MLEEIVPLAIGKPERWFPKDRLASKFHDCCSTVIGRALAEEIYGLAQSLETVGSLVPLNRALGRVVRK